MQIDTRHKPISISSPTGAFYDTVGMLQVQHSCGIKLIGLNWGHPIGEDWNVSIVNIFHVPMNKEKHLEYVWCAALELHLRSVKNLRERKLFKKTIS